jgi:nucleotidyltransferase substrate binding protein (TIGR01987 family)
MISQQSLKNCEKAVEKLVEFLKFWESHPSEAVQAGVIQAFEFTFEVFWKTFQKIGQSEGVAIASPKSALSFALQSGLIENETVWLNLLNDRNMTSHTYHEMLAQEIFERIKEAYALEFENVYKKLSAQL